MYHRKIWRIYSITQTDAIFIHGLGCKFDLIQSEPQQLTAPDGSQWHYVGSKHYVKITTTCEKQEMMLKLKYEDNLILESIIHVKLECR